MTIFKDMVTDMAHVMLAEPFAVAAVFLVMLLFMAVYTRGLIAKNGLLAAAKIENDVRTEDALRNIVQVLQDIKKDIDKINEKLDTTQGVINKCSTIKLYEQKRQHEDEDD